MDENKKKLLIRSVVIGGIVGSLAVAFKSKAKVCTCVTNCYEKTTEVLKFVNENRTEIIEQLKTTSDKVTKTIDETNHDLKAITENIKHLKDSSSQMISTVQETKDHLVTMYETCREKFDEGQEIADKKDA
ncbi:hypothetical protein H1D32_03065 [Anaerobacillus sp. CMMVII]|uniref:hypothetical protein n=1 Tax=Anaerobacillus sp. CMMVII TaxID=2755588 RepID=UPI0021B7E021|nr:hypothetical protein [Anaerobacillus sp. CMMVII]MCT8136825.1 hypothetical protein [Anaerobacillus sp. CMMVII]